MKRLRTLFIALTLVMTSYGIANAQVVKATDPALQKIIDTFFKKYESSPGDAVDYIFVTNKSLRASNLQQINTLKEKLTATTSVIGAFNGAERIMSKKATSSFIFFSYLAKHENEPLRFTFIFYKPKDEWELYRFKFDDSVDAELEEAGKLNLIK